MERDRRRDFSSTVFNGGLIPLIGNRWRRLAGAYGKYCIRDETRAYRVIYIATFAEAVYVLHDFQKKTQRTARRDVDLAASRLRDLGRRAR